MTGQAKPPRKLDGPRSRNPVESRQKILEAGMRNFARAGLDGARVTDIIQEAEFSHRMLYHYFANKEELYKATLEFAYQQIREAERDLHLEAMPPLQGIEMLVAFTFDYYVKYPQFMALLSQENLNGGRYVRESQVLRDMQRPLISTLQDLLQRGRDSGEIRYMPDPVQLYIDIAGLCYFGIVNRHTLAAIFGPNAAEADYLARRRDHVIGFVRRALGQGD